MTLKVEFADSKLWRDATFSRRQTRSVERACELSVLTRTHVLLPVAGPPGHAVYLCHPQTAAGDGQ